MQFFYTLKILLLHIDSTPIVSANDDDVFSVLGGDDGNNVIFKIYYTCTCGSPMYKSYIIPVLVGLI